MSQAYHYVLAKNGMSKHSNFPGGIEDLPYRASSRPSTKPDGPAPEIMTGCVAETVEVPLHRSNTVVHGGTLQRCTRSWIALALPMRADNACISMLLREQAQTAGVLILYYYSSNPLPFDGGISMSDSSV